MKESNLLAELLLKEEGLKPGHASDLLLEQMRYLQNRAERRERFWLRIACGLWIIFGLCLLSHTLNHALETPDSWRDIQHLDQALLPLDTTILLAAIFSSVRLFFVQRQAGHSAMQLTLAALTQEIRELKRQQEAIPEKKSV
jgi:hypothetical protein